MPGRGNIAGKTLSSGHETHRTDPKHGRDGIHREHKVRELYAYQAEEQWRRHGFPLATHFREEAITVVRVHRSHQSLRQPAIRCECRHRVGPPVIRTQESCTWVSCRGWQTRWITTELHQRTDLAQTPSGFD